MAKHPAAFINAIADEGTKAEAVKCLQDTWDELCEVKAKLAKYEALHEQWRISEDFFKQHLAKHIDYVFSGGGG